MSGSDCEEASIGGMHHTRDNWLMATGEIAQDGQWIGRGGVKRGEGLREGRGRGRGGGEGGEGLREGRG